MSTPRPLDYFVGKFVRGYLISMIVGLAIFWTGLLLFALILLGELLGTFWRLK
jgi:hypothetical protein